MTILDVRGLVTEFHSKRGVVRAVDQVSFSVPAGGAVGVVGESGSGKSVTALSVMRCWPNPPDASPAGRSCSTAPTSPPWPSTTWRRCAASPWR